VFYSKKIILVIVLIFIAISLVFSQDNKQDNKLKEKNQPVQSLTGETVAEGVILFYGARENLSQIRKTTIERGKLAINNSDGSIDNVNYEKRILRGESINKDRIRNDLEFVNARYAMIYNNEKIFGLYNNETFFNPKPEDVTSFQNQMYHSVEALLRYKENGSKVELLGKEKKLGVEYHILEVTDKENKKTKFFVSVKLLRVAWLEYQSGSVKYSLRFFDFRYAQNTLVSYRQTLFANDKQTQEINISTISFGQKVDETYFEGN
jgi:hypothetical protein